MGIRASKGVRLGGGKTAKVGIGSGGPSVKVGGKGGSVKVGRKGARVKVGGPGGHVSYNKTLK